MTGWGESKLEGVTEANLLLALAENGLVQPPADEEDKAMWAKQQLMRTCAKPASEPVCYLLLQQYKGRNYSGWKRRLAAQKAEKNSKKKAVAKGKNKGKAIPKPLFLDDESEDMKEFSDGDEEAPDDDDDFGDDVGFVDGCESDVGNSSGRQALPRPRRKARSDPTEQQPPAQVLQGRAAAPAAAEPAAQSPLLATIMLQQQVFQQQMQSILARLASNSSVQQGAGANAPSAPVPEVTATSKPNAAQQRSADSAKKGEGGEGGEESAHASGSAESDNARESCKSCDGDGKKSKPASKEPVSSKARQPGRDCTLVSQGAHQTETPAKGGPASSPASSAGSTPAVVRQRRRKLAAMRAMSLAVLEEECDRDERKEQERRRKFKKQHKLGSNENERISVLGTNVSDAKRVQELKVAPQRAEPMLYIDS
eukprot:5807302-Pleurochrysis_carterae.AAC.1